MKAERQENSENKKRAAHRSKTTSSVEKKRGIGEQKRLQAENQETELPSGRLCFIFKKKQRVRKPVLNNAQDGYAFSCY